MSSAVSLPKHTFTEQASSSKRLTSGVHILSPESIDISIIETEYGKNSVIEMNFMAMMQKIDQVLGKLTTISDDVGKIFNYISTQTNVPQQNAANVIDKGIASHEYK